MNASERANIAQLEISRRSLKQRIDSLLEALRQDYKQSLTGNVIYRKYSGGKLLWTLLLLAGALYLLSDKVICSQIIFSLTQAIRINTGSVTDPYAKTLTDLLRMFLLLLCIAQVVNVFRFFYSKHIEGGGKKLKSIEKAVSRRMEEMEKSDFGGAAARAAVMNDAAFKADKPNDLGEKMMALHTRFADANKTSVRIRKICGAVLSAFYYLFGFAVIWRNWEELRTFAPVPLLLLTCFGVYTYFTIDMVLCSIGEYLGKFMRPFGCLLAVIYCGFLYYTVGSEYTAHPLHLDIAQKVIAPPVTTGQLMVLLQLIALIAGILTADYLGMRTAWQSGFHLVLSYGANKAKTRGSVIRRGLWSVPWVIAAWYAGCRIGIGPLLVLFPLLWWRSMPLMKPFGSTLYTFFGRAKCVSISLMSFALFFPYLILHQQTVTEQHLMCLGIAFLIYLILGAIVKNRNDHSMFFDFMHHFL